MVGGIAVWFGSLAGVLRGRRRSLGTFLVTPVTAVAVVAAVMTGFPQSVRWLASEVAFEDQVSRLPTPSGDLTEWPEARVPGRIGLYPIDFAYYVPGGIVFYESDGALIDDAGFAYLPDGPTPELDTGWFERPEFTHLGGAWYAWTASW